MGKTPHPLDRWRAANPADAEASGETEAAGNPPENPDAGPDELLLVEPVGDDPSPAVAPADDEPGASMPPRRARDVAMGVLFGLLAAAWIALWLAITPSRFELPAIAGGIALASGPLALLGIVFMLLQRGPRSEARRFGATALSMRLESRRLEDAVARVTTLLDHRRAVLATHASALIEEGNRAAGKLQQVGMDLRDETDLLVRHAELLHNAAGAARADVSGLAEELPASLALVGEVNDRIESIGGSARQHAEGLASALSAIVARAQEADELIGAASGRLATQIGRIETRTERTARTIDEAASALGTTVDATLDRASASIEQSRSSLELQRDAMAAMIDHGRAALDEAGTAAVAALAHRLGEMSTLADGLSAQLARQDEDARRLVANLDHAIGTIEERFEALGTTGAEQTAGLAELVVALSEHVDNLGQAVTNSLSGARTLTDRANGLRIAFDAIVANLERDLPQSMQRMQSDAAHGDATIRAISAQAEQLAETVERASSRLDSAGLTIDRQREAIAGLGDQAARRMADIAAEGDAMLERQRQLSAAFAEQANARLAALRDQSYELARLVAETESSVYSLSELSGGSLIDAILKVRETAGEAARSVQAALASIAPETIERTIGDQVARRIHLISDTAEAAVIAANQASERLLQKLLSLTETAAAMEKRVGAAEARNDEPGDEAFNREVAILVQHLNSAAIDVTKLLSHDVPDGAWKAYLHGDQGVFTRTAVRLLRQEEASQVAVLYNGNADFHGHVDRYVRDFEALLRRVLAGRDGGALAVTILSSDMGKLYVALAQAIERLPSQPRA